MRVSKRNVSPSLNWTPLPPCYVGHGQEYSSTAYRKDCIPITALQTSYRETGWRRSNLSLFWDRSWSDFQDKVPANLRIKRKHVSEKSLSSYLQSFWFRAPLLFNKHAMDLILLPYYHRLSVEELGITIPKLYPSFPRLLVPLKFVLC